MDKETKQELQKLTQIIQENAARSDKQFQESMTYTNKNIEELALMVGKGFEHVDKRFEQVDKRFEQVDKRFEQVDRQFTEIREEMQGMKKDIQETKQGLAQVKDTMMRREDYYIEEVGAVKKRVEKIESKVGIPHHASA